MMIRLRLVALVALVVLAASGGNSPAAGYAVRRSSTSARSAGRPSTPTASTTPGRWSATSYGRRGIRRGMRSRGRRRRLRSTSARSAAGTAARSSYTTAGQVVGYAYHPPQDVARVLVDPGGRHGRPRDARGRTSWPNAVNEHGQVVGSSNWSGVSAGRPRRSRGRRGAAWSTSAPSAAPAWNTTAWGVNDSGWVVGSSGTASGESHAYLRARGRHGRPRHARRLVELGDRGERRGQVVGTSKTASGDQHAFSWTQTGGMVDLGTLGGTTSSASR